MNPAPPSGCAPACSRDDSQQETGNPEHASAQRGVGIHCGRTYRRMLLTYLKREDARCKRTAARNRKAEKETQTKRKHRKTPGEQKTRTPKQKAATRPRRRKTRNAQPLGRNKNSHKKSAKCLDVAERDGVRIEVPECGQDTLGGTKTSGPPGTAEVSVPPEPGNKSRRNKKNKTNTSSSPAILPKAKVVGTMPPTPKRGKGEEEETFTETISKEGAKALRATLIQRIISIPNQDKHPKFSSVIFPKADKRPKKKQKSLGCINTRGGGAHGPPLSSGKSSQGTRAPRVQVNSPLWEPPPRRKQQASS